MGVEIFCQGMYFLDKNVRVGQHLWGVNRTYGP